MTHKRSRALVIAGVVLMLAGILDPLEGSVVILAGSALAAAGAVFRKSRSYRLHVVAFVLIGLGVAALFSLSALGGVGGTSGRSVWWLVTCIPYPIGWVIGILAAVATLREPRYAPA